MRTAYPFEEVRLSPFKQYKALVSCHDLGGKILDIGHDDDERTFPPAICKITFAAGYLPLNLLKTLVLT